MAVNVQVVGRLGNDCEVKDGKSGQFITFSLATDEYKNGKNETTWLNVVDYSEMGLKLAQHLKKGSMINVHGVETVGIYTNKSGAPQVSRDIRAFKLDFVNSGQSGSTQTNESTVKETGDATCGQLVKKPTAPTPTVATNKGDDELPF